MASSPTNNRTARPPAQNLYSARGPATTFDQSKYKIENLSYPSDLMADDKRYGGNYVIFYINVAIDSKLFKDKKDVNGFDVETISDTDVPPRDRGDLIAMNLTPGKLTAAYGTGAMAVAGIVGAVTGGKDAAIKAVAAGAVPTVGVGIAANMAASATRQQKRLKTAIALHTPNQLQITYGAQWSDQDTSALAMGAAAAGMAGDIVKSIMSDKKGDFGETLKNSSPGAQALATNITLSKAPGAGGVSAATGLAANPKKEQLFQGVDFRSFTFDYQFFPRNSIEAQNVLRIIKELKYHMHPEFKDSNNFIYIYPSEFDIYHYNGGKENLNLHRHTSCVLTSLNVNYTPNGSFNSFPDGMPTQINVSMSFRELSLLTKDKIKDGM